MEREETKSLFQSNKHLRADEKVLWSGKPVKMPFIVLTLATVPFGLIFLGFSIFWMWGAASAEAPGFFTLFGLPFILIGLGLTVGPLIRHHEVSEHRIHDY